jgi:hypothetical protein
VLAWLAAAAPGGRGTTALVFATAQAGGLLLPLAIGQLVDASTPAVIPTTILVGGAGLPGRDPAPAPLGRARPVTAASGGQRRRDRVHGRRAGHGAAGLTCSAE